MLVSIAELLVLAIAFVATLVNGPNQFLEAKAGQTARVAEAAASSFDWSSIDRVRKGDDEKNPLFIRYRGQIRQLAHRYFRPNDGGVYVDIIDHGEEYDINSADHNVVDVGKETQLEATAFSSHEMTYSRAPISDDNGTSFRAYVPVMRGGKVLGLIEADFDSAPVPDFQNVAWSVFWRSVLIAVVVSLLISYLIVIGFPEPRALVQKIDDVRQQTSDESVIRFWNGLSDSEKLVFPLLAKGSSNAKIGMQLGYSESRVRDFQKTLKVKILEVTGEETLDRRELPVTARGILEALQRAGIDPNERSSPKPPPVGGGEGPRQASRRPAGGASPA